MNRISERGRLVREFLRLESLAPILADEASALPMYLRFMAGTRDC